METLARYFIILIIYLTPISFVGLTAFLAYLESPYYPHFGLLAFILCFAIVYGHFYYIPAHIDNFYRNE